MLVLQMIKRQGSIMPAIFDVLYREYCRARLAEMRKQLLLRNGSHEATEAICNALYPDDVGDQGSDLSSSQNASDRDKQI